MRILDHNPGLRRLGSQGTSQHILHIIETFMIIKSLLILFFFWYLTMALDVGSPSEVNDISGGLLSYAAPAGSADLGDHVDREYDGVDGEDGLGRLADGQIGGDFFLIDIGYARGDMTLTIPIICVLTAIVSCTFCTATTHTNHSNTHYYTNTF